MEKEEILDLYEKVLPKGTSKILSILHQYLEKVERISTFVESEPLLIIGRDGIIFRLSGEMKISNPELIEYHLTRMFSVNKTKIFLFVNLTPLRIPTFVSNVLEEVGEYMEKKSELFALIDDTLDKKNEEKFKLYLEELKLVTNKIEN